MRRSAFLKISGPAAIWLLLGLAACAPLPLEPSEQIPDGGAGDLGVPPWPAVTIVECGALPAPPAGERCAVQPAAGGSKSILLRGAVLLPDQVLRGGEVLIDETGAIACVSCDCHSREPAAATAAQVTCKDGAISPGLINVHDHITFTKAAPATHPINRYNHRHEWRLGVSGDPKRPKIPVSGGNNTQAVQWGELRQVLAGTTSLVGSGSAKGLLRNLDSTAQEGLMKMPVDSDTFPLGDSDGTRLNAGCAYPTLRTNDSISTDSAYLPHISEGINAAARNEFLCTSSPLGEGSFLVEDITSMVHGIALSAADARTTAERGAAVIWSPRSNISLYGHTAQTPMLDRAGVLLALGTDWTASGSMNLLRELRCAGELNEQQLGSYFSPAALFRMATINGAIATATNDQLGLLAKGYVADIAIYASADAARRDFDAVVKAEVEDVALVLRGGQPLSGDAAVMTALGAGPAEQCEAMDVCGVAKNVCVERETGMNLAALKDKAGATIYQLFACGTPPGEPTCVPSREGEFTGLRAADDQDGDGVPDGRDNCPLVFNPPRPLDGQAQADSDADGEGDACDACPLQRGTRACPPPEPEDLDGDGIKNTTDNCKYIANSDQSDSDLDGQGDLCDACPLAANPAGGGCPYSVRELRDPALASRPRLGTKVVVKDLLVVGLRSLASYGFHARDRLGAPDYAGILVFTGGAAPPVATDTKVPIKVGDIVQVAGSLAVFSGQDELASITDLRVTGTAPVVPFEVKARDLQGGQTSPAGRLANLLVRVQGVTMRRLVTPMGADAFYVTDEPTETCADPQPLCAQIGDFLLDNNKANGQPAFTAGGSLSSVVGVVSAFRSTYSVEPRSPMDLTP